jgi:hypothetical protein
MNTRRVEPAAGEVDKKTLRAAASAPFLSHIARLHTDIAEQESHAVEAPRRRAVLNALRRALSGHEVSSLDFDTTLPANVAAYRQALDDVRSELTCDGRVIRSAAAILALERLRGKAPR